jgi:hypothetical protein
MQPISRRFPFVLAALLLVACTKAQKNDDKTHLAEHVPPTPDSTKPASADATALTALIDSIKQLRGEYRFEPTKGWAFSNEPQLIALLRSMEPFADSAVVRMVDCLDASTPSLTTVDGRAALTGVLCYEALRRSAVPIGYEDDPDFTWKGYLKPTATSADLQEAKKEWQRVVESGKYRLN